MPNKYIKLDGNEYLLDTTGEDFPYTKYKRAELKKEDQDQFWHWWHMRSFHGGERQEHILKESDLENFAYHDGEGIDISDWGKVKIQPTLARGLAIQSATMPMTVTADGQTLVVGITTSPYIKYTGDGASWSNGSTPSNASIVDIITAADGTMYAIQGSVSSNKIIVSTNSGANWSNALYGLETSGQCQKNNGENTTTAIHLAAAASATDDAYNGMALIFTSGTGIGQTATVSDYDGTSKIATISAVATPANGTTYYEIWTATAPLVALCLTYCAGQLYALTSSSLVYWDGSEWGEAAEWGGTCVCTFQENVYFAKNDTLFKWTGQSTFQDDRLPAGFVITGLFPYRKILWITGYFWVQGAKKGATFYIIGGYEGHLFSLTHSGTADYGIRGLAGSDDEVYIANPKRGGVDRYDLTDSGLSSGPATGTAMYIPPKSCAYFDGYVAVGRYDNVAGSDGVWIANVANPATYRTSAWFTTSEYDFGYPNEYKWVKQITVAHKALAAGQSIKIEYSVDGGTTYVIAGWSSTPGDTSKTFVLSAVRGRTFKLKLTLTAGTSQASTPTLTEVLVAAAPSTEADWTWDLRLMLPRSRQGDTLITAMENSADDQKVMAFTDLREQDYNVVIDNISIRQRAGDEYSATVYLVLYSV